jgi:hypothetical protein
MPAWTVIRSSSAAALATALLTSGATAVSAAEATDAAARSTKIRCVNQDPERGMPAAHRFRLPKRDWETQLLLRSCKNKRGKLTVQVVWRRGAGSRDSMARYLEATAASKPGFDLVAFDTNTKKFKSPKRKTRKYEYTYRGDNGRRRVIAFGDRYTLLRVTAPNSHKTQLKKAANLARKTMVRRLR